MKKLGFSIAMVALALAQACGSDETAGPAPSTTACEKVVGIATKLGCQVGTCALEEGCEAEHRALFDCIASDYSQCHCESDGDLNCEGAWKANEGPAKCIAEYQSVDTCEEANADD